MTIGVLAIKRGVDKPGAIHFLKAPSKMNKRRYAHTHFTYLSCIFFDKIMNCYYLELLLLYFFCCSFMIDKKDIFLFI